MSFGDFFFLLLIFIPLTMLWFFALTDLSERTDLSGPAKGLWAVAIVLLPIMGLLIYFITRPDSLATPLGSGSETQQAAGDGEFESMIERIDQLAELHNAGTLSAEEFASAKARLLES